MAYSQTQKLLLAILFAAVLLLFALVFLGSPSREISVLEFKEAILPAEKFSIVMDLRGAQTPGEKRAVMQCGVDLAASLNLLGKNETNSFAYDGGQCIRAGDVTTIPDCEASYSGTTVFRLEPGTGGSKFYKGRAEIQVPSFYEGSCIIAQAQ